MKHDIPLGTRVSFKNDSNVYVVDSYQELLACEPDCDLDHDHYPEPFICVRVQSWTAKPYSELEHIFDKNGVGHKV